MPQPESLNDDIRKCLDIQVVGKALCKATALNYKGLKKCCFTFYFNAYLFAVKFFSAIFSIYILVLAVMPCHDTEDFCLDTKLGLSLSSNNIDNNFHTVNDETCSPFCNCACCGQSVSLFFYPASIVGVFLVSSQDFPNYSAAYLSEVCYSIWQPPKMC